MDGAPDRIDGLFVQSAAWSTSDDDELTLHGIVGLTVYFADRPRREVWHMPTNRFLELWEEGRGVFDRTRRVRCSRSSSTTPSRTPT